ncbi:2-phosphosulfolactate phosphatase [Methanotorris formicicus]|uniref:2-phosphosulfolactate phosphatase n=1 Tax=Methanotorris formicicus Mc-S-70 TaxID=647171 RepID=H1KX45_9EURY|nr:2-phosphosulfolactate phosphatase [Methanotorris formicicus]EHP88570.1 2-phosphosulfolactate phosphatase [Methanotorris formicicus Mc-S-70]
MAIVIDILRASTTINTLLQLCNEVYITDSIEKANSYENTIKIGERNGKKIEEFDFGNSPTDILKNKEIILEHVKNGGKVVLTTTNGTRVMKRVFKNANYVLIGSITNAKYVAEKAVELSKSGITLVPCHRKGTFAIEDVIGAGLIARYIEEISKEKTKNEEVLAAKLLTKGDWKSLILNSNSADNLRNLGYHGDLMFCISENSQNVVGMFDGEKVVKI